MMSDLTGTLKLRAPHADVLGMSDSDEPRMHRDARAYERPMTSEDRWLCDYLRCTAPALLQAMYRADYVAPKYSREDDTRD